MKSMSPQLRELIDAEAKQVTPPSGSSEAGLARLGQALSAGVPPGLDVPLPVEPSTLAGGGLSAALKGSAALKLGLVATLGAGVGVGAIALDSEPEPAPIVAPQPVRVVPETAEPQPLPPAVIEEAQEPTPPPVAAKPSRSVQPEDTLSAELELIQQARAALASGSGAKALEVLAQHARQFPKGQLTQDRLALRALALCQSGQLEQGRREAERLIQRVPSSVYVDRLRASCR